MMNLRRIAALVTLAALLSACEKKGAPVAVLRGGETTHYTALGKPADRRFIEFACPGCGRKTTPGTSPCPEVIEKTGCKTIIDWSVDKYTCPGCRGSGQCRACVMYGSADGKCWKCGGAGWTSHNVTCPNCHKSDTEFGKCPVCAGTQKCDWGCAPDGERSVMTLEQLKARGRESLAAVTPVDTPPPAVVTPPAAVTPPPAATTPPVAPTPPPPAEGTTPPPPAEGATPPPVEPPKP